MRVLIQDRNAALLEEIDLDLAPLAGDCIQVMSGDVSTRYDVISRRFLVGPSRGPDNARRNVQLVVTVRQGCAVGSKGYDWGAGCPGGRIVPLA